MQGLQESWGQLALTSYQVGIKKVDSGFFKVERIIPFVMKHVLRTTRR